MEALWNEDLGDRRASAWKANLQGGTGRLGGGCIKSKDTAVSANLGSCLWVSL